MKYYWLSLVCALALCAGCYEEDDIHVTEGLEVSYTLPQGDHPYDKTIMDWYEQYGFYSLYIFEDKDIYWANENWEERFEDGSEGGGSLKGVPADPDYVGEQLEMVQTYFFDLYPDSLIAHYMPLKLLLCSELWNVTRGYDQMTWEVTDIYNKLWAYEGWDYIAVNGGSAEMNTITSYSKGEFQTEVNEVFLWRLYEEGVLEIPEAFGQISNYEVELAGYGNSMVADSIFKEGFLQDPLYPVSSSLPLESAIARDFESFLPLLARPMSWLEATPGEPYEYDNLFNAILVLKGCMHRDRDVNGLIRQKYNILMDMLEEKGIDIQQLQYPEFD